MSFVKYFFYLTFNTLLIYCITIIDKGVLFMKHSQIDDTHIEVVFDKHDLIKFNLNRFIRNNDRRSARPIMMPEAFERRAIHEVKGSYENIGFKFAETVELCNDRSVLVVLKVAKEKRLDLYNRNPNNLVWTLKDPKDKGHNMENVIFVNSKKACVTVDNTEFKGSEDEVEKIARYIGQYGNIIEYHVVPQEKTSTVLLSLDKDATEFMMDSAERKATGAPISKEALISNKKARYSEVIAEKLIEKVKEGLITTEAAAHLYASELNELYLKHSGFESDRSMAIELAEMFINGNISDTILYCEENGGTEMKHQVYDILKENYGDDAADSFRRNVYSESTSIIKTAEPSADIPAEGGSPIAGTPVVESEAVSQESEMQLLLNGSRGVFIPKNFVTEFDMMEWHVDPKYVEFLSSAEPYKTDEYWEAWQYILDSAYFEQDGKKWTLHQDGDLWAVSDQFNDWDRFGALNISKKEAAYEPVTNDKRFVTDDADVDKRYKMFMIFSGNINPAVRKEIMQRLPLPDDNSANMSDNMAQEISNAIMGVANDRPEMIGDLKKVVQKISTNPATQNEPEFQELISNFGAISEYKSPSKYDPFLDDEITDEGEYRTDEDLGELSFARIDTLLEKFSDMLGSLTGSDDASQAQPASTDPNAHPAVVNKGGQTYTAAVDPATGQPVKDGAGKVTYTNAQNGTDVQQWTVDDINAMQNQTDATIDPTQVVTTASVKKASEFDEDYVTSTSPVYHPMSDNDAQSAIGVSEYLPFYIPGSFEITDEDEDGGGYYKFCFNLDVFSLYDSSEEAIKQIAENYTSHSNVDYSPSGKRCTSASVGMDGDKVCVEVHSYLDI